MIHGICAYIVHVHMEELYKDTAHMWIHHICAYGRIVQGYITYVHMEELVIHDICAYGRIVQCTPDTSHMCMWKNCTMYACHCEGVARDLFRLCSTYKALLREYRARLTECSALLREYRALLSEYSALLREYRVYMSL